MLLGVFGFAQDGGSGWYAPFDDVNAAFFGRSVSYDTYGRALGWPDGWFEMLARAVPEHPLLDIYFYNLFFLELFNAMDRCSMLQLGVRWRISFEEE